MSRPLTYPEDEGERTAVKAGKLMMELVDLEFVADMAQQLHAGLTGERVPEGWRSLDPKAWVPKYRGAILRHLRSATLELNATDPETGASHWAGVAVNAMICWGLERIEGSIRQAAAAASSTTPVCTCAGPAKDRHAPLCPVRIAYPRPGDPKGLAPSVDSPEPAIEPGGHGRF